MDGARYGCRLDEEDTNCKAAPGIPIAVASAWFAQRSRRARCGRHERIRDQASQLGQQIVVRQLPGVAHELVLDRSRLHDALRPDGIDHTILRWTRTSDLGLTCGRQIRSTQPCVSLSIPTTPGVVRTFGPPETRGLPSSLPGPARQRQARVGCALVTPTRAVVTGPAPRRLGARGPPSPAAPS